MPSGLLQLTSAEAGGDGVDAEAVGALAHRRVLEAEAGGAALRVVLVQVKVTQFTPEGHSKNARLHPLRGQRSGRAWALTTCCAQSPVTAEALHVVFAAALPGADITLLGAARGRAGARPGRHTNTDSDSSDAAPPAEGAHSSHTAQSQPGFMTFLAVQFISAGPS